MAVFVAKPSRGTLVFFGLVVAGVLAVRGYERHEVRVVQRDGPASEEALRFAQCLTGPHAVWIFREPDGPNVQARWGYTLTEWMRVAVTAPEVEGLAPDATGVWPLRCTEPLRGLTTRLRRVGGAQSTALDTEQLASLLRDASVSPLHLAARIDDGRLGDAVARVLAETYALSTGTRARWVIPVGGVAPEGPWPPRWRPLPPGVQRAVVAAADAVLTRGLVDGVAHRLRFDGRRVHDEVLGPLAPWDDTARGALFRASSEVGPVALGLGDTVRAYAWPQGFSAAAYPQSVQWQGHAAAGRFALLALDAGTLSLWAPLRPAGDAATTPTVTLGPTESHLAAVLGPADDVGPAWRVTALRPALDDATVVQYRARLEGDAVVAEPVPVQLVPADAPPVALQGARFATCTAGAAQYLAVMGERTLSVMRSGRDGVVEVASVAVQWPRARTAQLHCDVRRALLGPVEPEMLQAQGAWQQVQFDGGGGNIAALQMPVAGDAAQRVMAVALAPEGALAAVHTGDALRVLRLDADGTTWRLGPLLATLRPTPDQRRTVERVVMRAEGARLVALVQGGTQTLLPLTAAEREMSPRPPPRYSPAVPFTLVAWSDDGGRRFVTF